MYICGSLCMLRVAVKIGGILIFSIFGRRQTLWKGFFVSGIRSKNGQRAVPAWIHVKLREGPRTEIRAAMTKNVVQLILRLGIENTKLKSQAFGERDPGEKDLQQSEGSIGSVMAMANQRPGSEQRDELAFLVAV